MARESTEAKKARARAVLGRLDAEMPEARIQLDFGTPMELLVAVILSAQCTDERVNKVTPALFRRYRSVAAYARADVAEVEGLVRTCGLFRAKARGIVAAAQAICERHGGEVPLRRDELEALPGVGTKTAGVVAIHLGGDDAFPVDTHIRRIAGRLGLTRHTDPDKVEADLQRLVPKELWAKGHQLLIWHGRRTCTALKPLCEACPVATLCPKIGVRKKKAATRPRRSALPRGRSSGASSASG